MIEAIKLMASLEGILLDSVYIGKAMAGLIDMVRTGQFEKTKRSYRCAGLIRLARRDPLPPSRYRSPF